MSTTARRSIVERIESIAAWRRERGQQDLYGLGPEVAARGNRSAEGLDELARYIDAVNPDDHRLRQLVQLSFRGEIFDPGAALLIELGRFRFHDPSTTVEAFLHQMIEFAAIDASEERALGGPQVDGDNPWRADFEIRLPLIDDLDT